MLKHAILALCLGSGAAFTPIRPVGLSRRLHARAAARTLYDKVRENVLVSFEEGCISSLHRRAMATESKSERP